jgi:hypothetical protein
VSRTPRVLVIVLLVLGMLGVSMALLADLHEHLAEDDCIAEQAGAEDGCDTPCPSEDEDGDCPDGCEGCACCPASASAPAVVVASPPSPNPALGSAHAHGYDQSPVSRPGRRLFRPPRTSLS